jgi:hypothetical protein
MLKSTGGPAQGDDAAPEGEVMSDEAIELLKRERFQQRVQRVLVVMEQERIDWRGVPFVSADGRIGVRVVPVEMSARTEGEA